MSRLGVARCLWAAVLFGAAAPAASELAGRTSAFTLAGLLYLGAGLWVLPSVIRRPPSRRAIEREWRPAATAVLVGGALGPVLLVAGLARTDAASASILLNTELVATVILAALFFREHIGRRVASSVVLIAAAGVILTWQPDAGLDIGAVLVVAACACWGLDNCVTAAIEQFSPHDVVAMKGAVAGGANLAIGIVGSGWQLGLGETIAAVAVGAAGYGWSITLWVAGARELGAARAQVIFAAAPFIGAVIAWSVLGDPVTVAQWVAVPLALGGVAISLRSDHVHEHRHAAIEHDHEHDHGDGHHDHDHDDGFSGRHRHPHVHEPVVHAHPHVPDLHHRHEH
ncbi:MAG: EamA family transporter [Acidimicrobiaceae bacterium]|nr:EamA family transporter [Acidimicrobiaceae bacterium]